MDPCQGNQCSFLLQGKEEDGDRPRCWLFLLALNPFGGARQMKQLLDEANEVREVVSEPQDAKSMDQLGRRDSYFILNYYKLILLN